jgi:hypothetical protein
MGVSKRTCAIMSAIMSTSTVFFTVAEAVERINMDPLRALRYGRLGHCC